jgi:speckle-type POZ protein
MSKSTNSLKSIEFTWKIENFSQQKFNNGPGKWIRSGAFFVDCKGSLKFFLKFYPQGNVKSDDTKVPNEEKWASLFLEARSKKTYDTSHLIEFSILGANGEKFGIGHFHKNIPFKGWGYPKFIRLTDLENPVNNLLQNDTLTICCRVVETKWESEDCNCLIETTETRRTLGEDLAALLDDKSTDFVFNVENVKIGAHKAILGARSRVFAAMMKNKTNETEVTDVTPAAFRALLRFIYTGHCEVGNLAKELLVAAKKYDMRELKDICAKELRRNLTVDNAVHLLILSDLHQANDLKYGAIRFINKNTEAVTKTPSWTSLTQTHRHLIVELYCELIKDI